MLYNIIIIIIVFLVFLAASFVPGVLYLVKYAKEKEKKHLVLGLVLTLGLPGLVILFVLFWLYQEFVAVSCYEPVGYVAKTLSPAFVAFRQGLRNKYKPKLP